MTSWSLEHTWEPVWRVEATQHLFCCGLALSLHLALPQHKQDWEQWVPQPELLGIKAAVLFFGSLLSPCAAPPTSPLIALLMGGSSGCQGATLSSLVVHQVEAARPFCLLRRSSVCCCPSTRECRLLPKAATDVLIPHFCQNPSGFLQATGGSDIGTGRPRTGNHCSLKALCPRSGFPGDNAARKAQNIRLPLSFKCHCICCNDVQILQCLASQAN